MSNLMQLTSLSSTHPELFAHPYRDELPCKTLTQLGLTASASAKKLGYVCIMPHTSTGQKSYPGLWVKPDDYDVINNLVLKIEEDRKNIIISNKLAKIKKQENLKKKNQSKAIVELAKKAGWTHQAVRKSLSSEFLEIFKTYPENPDLQLIHKYAIDWGDLKLIKSEKFYYLHPSGFEINPASPIVLESLLLNDKFSYIENLDKLLKIKQNEAAMLYSKWKSSRPSWFDEVWLNEWSIFAVNNDVSENLAHPLIRFNGFPDVTHRNVQVDFFNKKIHGEPDIFKAAQIAWEMPKLLTNTISDHLKIALRQGFYEEISALLLTFIKNNPYTVDAARNEFSSETWDEFLKTVFINSLHSKYDAKIIFENAKLNLKNSITNHQQVLAVKRCRSELPKAWKDFYPLARKMKREITFIYGPTNSGKTHQALEHLKLAKTGAYLGPLRLLALEVFDRLTDAGTPTSLITGELVHEVEGAMHTSSTIEMVNLGQSVDVAIIDEMQMVADPDRGSAWLQAFLGAPAKHLIVLGSESALKAVRLLAEITGEPLKEIKLERLNKLSVNQQPMKLKSVPKGSALIVFSRQAALSLASHMRKQYNRNVSVVYGALSPEVRAEQARQFREGQTDILVSTDAIGMGLNLPIHTIVFTTTTKWNGVAEVKLDHSLTCQISGRAGRFGLHEFGHVSATNSEDLKYITRMLAHPIKDVKTPFTVGLNQQMADSIARHLETESLVKVIGFFKELMTLESWAIPACSDDQFVLAKHLDKTNLASMTKLVLSNAPAVDKSNINGHYPEMINCIVNNKIETLNIISNPVLKSSLEKLERSVKDLTLYSWIHYRFPDLFPRNKEAQALLKELNTSISKLLAKTGGQHCTDCGKLMPWDHTFPRCESCFRKGRYHRNYDFDEDDEDD